MDSHTQSGDAYILSLSRYIRTNEKQLSGAVALNSRGGKPLPLSISLHHLSYLLLRFDALGLAAGSLDEPLPPSSRPRSTFYVVGRTTTANKNNNAETMSLGSVRSALSRVSLASLAASATTSSWFSSGPPPSTDAQLKYIYSAFTKLPALDVVAAPVTGLIEGFEDEEAGPATLTPFDVFRNLQLLSFTDVDPRNVSGWDRLSCQLRSLSLTRTGIEDIEDFFVDHIVRDVQRRAKAGAAATEVASSSSSPNGHSTAQLPSLAWHFLSNLGLSSSSLTFLPTLPLPSLRSLDLSHNLLNSIPSTLAHLPRLASLDLSGNLIEDTRGAAASLPAGTVRTLKLRNNRIESLSGLDGVTSLRQVDLRDNCIYEADELGRLAAQLDDLTNVWVKGNPLCVEYPDWRVEVLIEFVKEGWKVEQVRIDGEQVGWLESRRVAERVNTLGVEGMVRRRERSAKGKGEAAAAASATNGEGSTEDNAQTMSAQVVAVKHRAAHGQHHHHRKTTSQGGASRRENNGSGDSSSGRPQSSSKERAPVAEVSEAEQLKRDVLGQDSGEGRKTNGDKAKGAEEAASKSRPRKSTSPSRPRSPSKTAAAKKQPRARSPRPPSAAAGSASPQLSGARQQEQQTTNSSLELRARIDRLKQEVGDDWMRVLSSGSGSGGLRGGAGTTGKMSREPSTQG